MAWSPVRLTGMAAVVLAVALLTPGPVGAATLIVTDLGDGGAPGQLRTLINQAAPGDTIVIPAGTITLTGAAGENANASGDLDILKSLTIQGAGPDVTIIDGGGLDRVFEVVASATVTLSGMTIRNGSTGGRHSGGGILNHGALMLGSSLVSGNTASDGGGISNNAEGRAMLSHVTISRNTASRGGGIFNGGTLALTDSTVDRNLAGVAGGIINYGTLTLTRATISDNTSATNAGGIQNEIGGVATLTHVTISGNTAYRNGGGIRNKGALTVTNSTFSGNVARSGSGGGINNGTGGTATLLNVTISGNAANGKGGGGIDNHGTVTVQNSLVAYSVSGGNCSGVITSLGHNLDSGTTCLFTCSGDITTADPLLGPLQNNGGSTYTHALRAGSPAIDKGDNLGCPSTDQRGVNRPLDGRGKGRPICDIGAYELALGSREKEVGRSPPGLPGLSVVHGAHRLPARGAVREIVMGDARESLR